MSTKTKLSYVRSAVLLEPSKKSLAGGVSSEFRRYTYGFAAWQLGYSIYGYKLNELESTSTQI